jgi:hypothetical protein
MLDTGDEEEAMGNEDGWTGDRHEHSGDPGHSEVAPQHLPRAYASPYGNEEAARMGLDRNTLEGAQLHFFGSLQPGKRSHKLVAWVALILMFGVPLLLSALNVLRG